MEKLLKTGTYILTADFVNPKRDRRCTPNSPRGFDTLEAGTRIRVVVESDKTDDGRNTYSVDMTPYGWSRYDRLRAFCADGQAYRGMEEVEGPVAQHLLQHAELATDPKAKLTALLDDAYLADNQPCVLLEVYKRNPALVEAAIRDIWAAEEAEAAEEGLIRV